MKAVTTCYTYRWIKSWKKNNWKKSDKKVVLNQDIIKKIDKILQKYPNKIKFIKVKGHSGDHGNDMADDLAKKGAMKLL